MHLAREGKGKKGMTINEGLFSFLLWELYHSLEILMRPMTGGLVSCIMEPGGGQTACFCLPSLLFRTLFLGNCIDLSLRCPACHDAMRAQLEGSCACLYGDLRVVYGYPREIAELVDKGLC